MPICQWLQSVVHSVVLLPKFVIVGGSVCRHSNVQLYNYPTTRLGMGHALAVARLLART